MGTSQLWLELLIGLLFSGFYFRSSLAFPPLAPPQSDPHPQQQHQQKIHPALEQVNTVRVVCHPDSLEIHIQADMFAVGAPVRGEDLRLGVEQHEYCRAAAVSAEEFRILVGLLDCGTRHWMTEDSLVYTNLLIYSPEPSPDGLVRMEEAVVPVECHYDRKYSLSSSSLTPTWIPFTSTQAAVETLNFDLTLVTDDGLYQRSSNVFYLGDRISVEASVLVGHHTGLRLFVSSCVATLEPDIHAVPRYVFIQDGCLVDSQLPGSRSHFLPRLQDDKLHLALDAFRFHEEERGQLYITCHLNAVPVNDADSPHKACTFIGGRWRSADANDYLCGQCNNQNEAGKGQRPGVPVKSGPRGFARPQESEAARKSAVAANIVWEQEARLGPLMVLPARHKSGPLPEDALPPLLNKISRPALYGSRWRGGLDTGRGEMKMAHLPEASTAEEEDEEEAEAPDQTEDGGEAAPEGAEGTALDPAPALTTKPEKDVNATTLAPTPVTVDVTKPVTTTMPSELPQTNDPK